MHNLPTTAALLFLGALGGGFGWLIGLPLPFLLGSLMATAPVAITRTRLPDGYSFPQKLRTPFIALIGAVIGAQVTPALVASLRTLAPSMAAIIAFVLAAQALNYLIFRRLGGYDRATAFYSGAPGGLIESISFGEAAGADTQRLVTQQFLRIILVIGALPLALSAFHGEVVGSASGLSFSQTAPNWTDAPKLALILGLGLALASLVKLPAGQLTGALLVSALLALFSAPLALPNWVVNLAQVVIGASLGLRFAGLSLAILRRSLWLALLSVSAMIAVGGLFAALLMRLTGEPFEVLLITFAPGGVNEMALVALSIGANPAFVTLHHIFRIFVTVIVLGILGPRITKTN